MGLAIGSFAGCLFELDRSPACGDGYVDHDSEPPEQCDPADPGLEHACAPGEAASCDPSTCTLSCCGDGRLDGGEACDGLSVRVLPSCQGWSCVGCEVICPRCGNGDVDPGEECDSDLGSVSIDPHSTRCEDVEVPGRPGQSYTSGPLSCRSDCQWDRSQCSLCGNGRVDAQVVDPNSGVPLNAAEHCDGDAFDVQARIERCGSVCPKPGSDCKAECGEGCLDIVIDSEDPGCCILPGYTRSAPTPCCCELPKDEVPSYCTDVFDPPIGKDPVEGVCPG